MTPNERNALIEEHVPLAKSLVGTIARRLSAYVEHEDLLSAGYLGLVQAADRYDASRGVPFRSFAHKHICGAVIDYVRNADAVPRSTREQLSKLGSIRAQMEQCAGHAIALEDAAECAGMSGHTTQRLVCAHNQERPVVLPSGECLEAADPKAENPLAQAIVSEDTERLKRAIRRLPQRERTVIRMRYFQQKTCDEIGAHLGVTGSRISQIHAMAVARLPGLMRRASKKRGKTCRKAQ